MGRVALWAVVVLLLFHGAVSLVSPKPTSVASPDYGGEVAADNQAVGAFAVRFVRAYLSDTSSTSLASLVAPGVSVPGGGGPAPEGMQVAQAEATATRTLSNGRAVVTVWCELLTGRVLYLAVPIIRDQADGVAALGPPAFVSASGIGRLDAQADGSQPIPGADSREIQELATRFVETYLSAADPAELKYLTAPASDIAPLGGFEPSGNVSVRQLGGGGGGARTVLATVTARDSAGTVYPLAYRLQLERRDRWYVAAVEGEIR